MSLVEQIQAEINQLKSQISIIPLQTRTLRIERTNCINVQNNPNAAKSGYTSVCRETPIIESYYTPQDQSQVMDLQNQISIKESQIGNILAELKDQAEKQLSRNTEPIKLNDTASSPTLSSIGIPGLVVIGGIIGLFILGRKN